jgi:hypothetical protein
MHPHRFALLLCCSLLVACGGDKAGTQGAAGDDGLPKPAAPGGSVTGMPNPGVAGTRPAASVVESAETAELPVPLEEGAVPPVDPTTQPVPIEGTPVELPEATLSEDPNAPPLPPVQDAASTTDPNAPRQ